MRLVLGNQLRQRQAPFACMHGIAGKFISGTKSSGASG
jgi:hypothetical protein